MTTAQRKRKLTEDTYVTIINNCKGSLSYTNRLGQDWLFGETGDEQQITVRELRQMKSQSVKFFKEQWIIFAEEDQDVIPYLKLEKYYQNVITPEYIEEIMMGDDFSAFENLLTKSSNNTKSMILSIARKKYKAGELTNVRVVRFIEDTLNVDIDVDNPRR